ncbi:hypothetical protein bcCo53_001204 (plasmid) [Borrelia coriaceae]|uniref:Cytosolic protein n=1 Tax=Borrelia coriaceae ATCC 43381 TaxID=1408429 RepID=W5SW16_9SPIR|nr:hypothetical protein [Borrelia coriaceae]AHH11087.1 hypothetical protein BCO_0000800 [Borrelia coriaceae ATCC 43381]UPA17035.1 hypothetical protein bcCo53_001204 [Borrelia coriaceae]
MGGKRLILSLFFVAIFFILSESCNASQSQEFATDVYIGNDVSSGAGFRLRLKNSDRELGIYCRASNNMPIYLYFILNSEHRVKIKSIKLNGEDVCINGSLSTPTYLGDRFGYGLKFNDCKTKWKELIRDAKGGDLTFTLLVMQSETRVEETYEFIVSAENLSLLIDLIEKVYVGKW